MAVYGNDEHNKKVILLLGKPATGKTASLRNMPLEKMAYINTDGKSQLPFKGKSRLRYFIVPEDPVEVTQNIQMLEDDPNIEYIVIDTLSFWMDSLEIQHVIFSKDSRGAWGTIYGAQIKELMQYANNKSKKTWIFMSHTIDADEKVNFVTETKCYGKGASGKLGIEAYFSNVVYTRKYVGKDKMPHYGLQVGLTEQSIGLSVRAPMGMWDEPFLDDNDIMQVLSKIDSFDEE